MIKTYPENKVKRMTRKADAVMYSGIIASGVCMLIGLSKHDNQLILNGITIAGITVIGVIWYCAAHIRAFAFCYGGVLEVKNGTVEWYHTKAFVYRVKELFETRFIPFEVKPISATRTLRLPVYGNVLSCTVGCIVMPDMLQSFYEAFLKTDMPAKDGTPESVVGAIIAIFLHQTRTHLVEMY